MAICDAATQVYNPTNNRCNCKSNLGYISNPLNLS